MAKVTYDVSDVEERSGERPKQGIYLAEIESAKLRTERGAGKDDDIEATFRIKGGDFDGAPMWAYVGLGASQDWKLKEFLTALGLKPKGAFDVDGENNVKTLVGKKCNIKVVQDTYNGEYSPKIGRFIKVGTDDEAETEADPEPAADDDEPTAAADGEFVASREGDDGIDSYDEWDDDDLAGEVEDRSLTVPGGRGSKRDKHIKALRADDEAQGGAAEEEEEKAPGEDDYDEWTMQDLLDELKTRQIDAPRGRKSEEKLIALLRDDDQKPAF